MSPHQALLLSTLGWLPQQKQQAETPFLCDFIGIYNSCGRQMSSTKKIKTAQLVTVMHTYNPNYSED